MEQEPSNIDRYFSDKLKSYQKAPSDAAWKKIQQGLDQPQAAQKKNRTIYYLSIAASFALVLTVGYIVSTFLKESPQTITHNVQEKDTLTVLPVRKTGVKSPVRTQTEDKPAVAQVPSVVKEKQVEWVTLSADATKREFKLPDSSTLYLHKNSKLTYRADFTASREVKLLEGEAFFEVEKRNGQSFSVTSHTSITEVLGTSFLIKSYAKAEKDEVYVISGKVSVTSIQAPARRVILLPNEKSVVIKNGYPTFETITEENYSAWKSEQIHFQNTPFSTVVKTLEEYYDVSLQINNPDILTCRFTGRFEKSSLNEAIQVLAATFNLSFNDKKGVYTLSGKGCK